MDDLDTTTLYRLLSVRLRKARNKKKISQKAVADALGIERSSVVNFEHGRQRFPVHTIYGFAKCVGITVADLFPSLDEIDANSDGGMTEVSVGEDRYTVPADAAQFVRDVASGKVSP